MDGQIGFTSVVYTNLWAMANASLLLLQKLKAVTGPKINPRGNQIKKLKCFTQQPESLEGGME